MDTIKKHRARPLYKELATAIQARKNCETRKPTIPFGETHNIDLEYAVACNGSCADCGMTPVECTLKPCPHYKDEWFDKWTDTINKLVDRLPSGSGWDSGTKIDLDASHANKIILYGKSHHMDDNGFYEGYTDHTVTVTPSLTSEFDLRISGRNRNDIKEYLHEMFDYALSQDVAYWLYVEQFPQFAVQSRWVDSRTQEFFILEDRGIGDNVMKYQRFSNLQSAMDYAADLMEQAFYAPKVSAQ